jgi:hypothetical protein
MQRETWASGSGIRCCPHLSVAWKYRLTARGPPQRGAAGQKQTTKAGRRGSTGSLPKAAAKGCAPTAPNVVAPVKLFNQLTRLHRRNTASCERVRDGLWTWLMQMTMCGSAIWEMFRAASIR